MHEKIYRKRHLPRLRFKMLPVLEVFSCLTVVLGPVELKGLRLSTAPPVSTANNN